MDHNLWLTISIKLKSSTFDSQYQSYLSHIQMRWYYTSKDSGKTQFYLITMLD